MILSSIIFSLEKLQNDRSMTLWKLDLLKLLQFFVGLNLRSGRSGQDICFI